MRLKCDNCIHEEVCRFKPEEGYPQFMKRVISENCKHFINRYSADDTVQPERCKYNDNLSCCYPIGECEDCPTNTGKKRGLQ